MKQRREDLAVSQMKKLRHINDETDNEADALKLALRMVDINDNGSVRTLLERLKKWVRDIPAAKDDLTTKLQFVLELELEEQPDEKAKHEKKEAAEKEREEHRCKRMNSQANDPNKRAS